MLTNVLLLLSDGRTDETNRAEQFDEHCGRRAVCLSGAALFVRERGAASRATGDPNRQVNGRSRAAAGQQPDKRAVSRLATGDASKQTASRKKEEIGQQSESIRYAPATLTGPFISESEEREKIYHQQHHHHHHNQR